jgi:hypothetical protein
MNPGKQALLAAAVAFALANGSFGQDTAPKRSDNASHGISARVDAALSQNALPEPLPGGPEVGVGGGVLQALPKPRDLPASLYAPPPPASPGALRVDEPYLVPDPLLDFPPASPPGWFGGAEIQILKSHLVPGLSNVVQPGRFISNPPTNGPTPAGAHLVALPAAPLDWTVSPRVFLGYRLPSGFGEFMLGYRHLGTDGSGTALGLSTPNALNSRFALDMFDVDYNSREWSLGRAWDMKWTFGLRSLFLFYDSQFSQPSSIGDAGNGVLQARNFNNLFGFGPHGALELDRRLGTSGWSLNMRADASGTFDWTQQAFFTRSTTLGPSGRPLGGETRAFGHQAAPIINGRVGLTWRPSATSGTRVFLGYQYEVLWDLVRVSQSTGTPIVPPSLGQFWNQGIVLQAAFHY